MKETIGIICEAGPFFPVAIVFAVAMISASIYSAIESVVRHFRK